MSTLAWILALAPLPLAVVGAVPASIANRRVVAIDRLARLAGSTALAIAAGTAMTLALGRAPITGSIAVDGLGVGVYADALTAVMLILVAFVGLIVIIYSRNYLDGDAAQGRFVKWLCLTLASVLVLVLSGNLAQFALAWIATSLSLHRLLLFYPHRPGARLAARKKFVFSRLGDACLIAACLLIWQAFGSLDFATVFAEAAGLRAHGQPPIAIGPICGLLIASAVIKSAQFPVHGWLPEVMETPTPVSALLHAGIINAGGFLVVRLSGLISLSPASLEVLAAIGGFTALFAGLVMLTQSSVKVALAWSTLAQMGFMLLQCGLGAFPAAVLHIVAHSLYKAHAFLTSGGVIDEARRDWPAPARGRPRTGLLAGALVVAVAITVAVAAGFQVTLATSPGVLTLGAVMAMGVALLLVRGIGEGPVVVAATAALAGAVVAVYFCLQWLAAWLLGGSVAGPRMAHGLADPLIAGLVMASFAGAIIVQDLARAAPAGRFRQALYIHLLNGLYVNAATNRLMARLSPAAGPRRSGGAAVTVRPGEIHAAMGEARGDAAMLARAACETVAPLWPLRHFVAVNPFLGRIGERFEAACARALKVAGGRLLMPGAVYREAVASGRIAADDLALAALLSPAPDPSAREVRAATVAEVLDTLAGAGAAAMVVDEISKFCAAYWDQGQAPWPAPWRGTPLFAAWRQAAEIDRAPEVRGLPGFRRRIAGLPFEPLEAIERIAADLGLGPAALAPYLERAAASIVGWMGHARYLGWTLALDGDADDTAMELLAIRMAWDWALLGLAGGEEFAGAWREAVTAMTSDTGWDSDPDVARDCRRQYALERGFQRRLMERLSPAGASPPRHDRPDAQVVCCIDVRCEIYRRALEAAGEEAGLNVATVGFAGFFGFAIEFAKLDHEPGGARCPALLRPRFRVRERIGGDEQAAGRLVARRRRAGRVARAWKAFRSSVVSSFPYVETMGLLFGGRLIGDAAGRPLATGDVTGQAARSGVALDEGPCSGTAFEARLDAAEGTLRGMSLTVASPGWWCSPGMAAASANNPFGSALDCGACGGHAGDVNARVAAAVLNEQRVRAGLAARGLAIPATPVSWPPCTTPRPMMRSCSTPRKRPRATPPTSTRCGSGSAGPGRGHGPSAPAHSG